MNSRTRETGDLLTRDQCKQSKAALENGDSLPLDCRLWTDYRKELKCFIVKSLLGFAVEETRITLKDDDSLEKGKCNLFTAKETWT